jgi:hypothetical protein
MAEIRHQFLWGTRGFIGTNIGWCEYGNNVIGGVNYFFVRLRRDTIIMSLLTIWGEAKKGVLGC